MFLKKHVLEWPRNNLEILERARVYFSLRIFLLPSGQFSDISKNRNLSGSLFSIIYGTTCLWFAIVSMYFDKVVQNS